MKNEDDVEYCCWKVLRSEVFLKHSDKVRYQLINIANEVPSCPVSQAILYPSAILTVLLGYLKWTSHPVSEESVDDKDTNNAILHIVYWILLLDGTTNLETLRKIRKQKCIPTMVDVLWHRSRGDYGLHAIALELLFEVCRSERLSEEDLGTKSVRT